MLRNFLLTSTTDYTAPVKPVFNAVEPVEPVKPQQCRYQQQK
jgi:hypothetical protein